MPDNFGSRIVVIDDEKHICGIVKEALGRDNYQINTFNDPKEGIEFITNNKVDLVLTDLVMGDFDGVHVLESALNSHPDAIVILMTAHPTVETAIKVLKKGAYDFMVKPFKLDLLRATVKRGLEHQKLVRDNVKLQGQVEFLKAVGSLGDTVDLESHMEQVVSSCQKEFSPKAVAVIEIDPKSKEIKRKKTYCETEDYLKKLVNLSTIKPFLNQKNVQPDITKTKVSINDDTYIQTLIAQPIYLRRRLHGVINILLLTKFDELTRGKLDVLSLLGSATASTISTFYLYQNLQDSYYEAIFGLANAIEARDPYTAGHTDRVSKIAEQIALRLNWSKNRIINLRMGCTLHDIGKIGVPDSILNKPGMLSEEEKEKMNAHPYLGLKIIKNIKLFRPAIPYIISHHENYDGSGYPKGLRGEEIPIEGRILAVADTFDAILSDRPYRKGKSAEFALGEIKKYAGKQFDPKIVELIIQVVAAGEIDFVRMYGREEDISFLRDETNQMVPA